MKEEIKKLVHLYGTILIYLLEFNESKNNSEFTKEEFYAELAK